jgi:hypothetical protein
MPLILYSYKFLYWILNYIFIFSNIPFIYVFVAFTSDHPSPNPASLVSSDENALIVHVYPLFVLWKCYLPWLLSSFGECSSLVKSNVILHFYSHSIYGHATNVEIRPLIEERLFELPLISLESSLSSWFVPWP